MKPGYASHASKPIDLEVVPSSSEVGRIPVGHCRAFGASRCPEVPVPLRGDPVEEATRTLLGLASLLGRQERTRRVRRERRCPNERRPGPKVPAERAQQSVGRGRPRHTPMPRRISAPMIASLPRCEPIGPVMTLRRRSTTGRSSVAAPISSSSRTGLRPCIPCQIRGLSSSAEPPMPTSASTMYRCRDGTRGLSWTVEKPG